MVRDTPPYGHAPTYQISLIYLERQKCYGPDQKILFKKQLFDALRGDISFRYLKQFFLVCIDFLGLSLYEPLF
jgi:hypothetical protein